MSNLNSLTNQLNMCINMQEFLIDLNKKLFHASYKYTHSIDTLQSAGCLSELLSELRRNENEFKDAVSKLIKYVENEHMEYIYKQSKTIQEQLSDA